ncbi:hypothetical protein BJY04DRAFT_178337 [Aspergillus karnatakaensis]|uniref:zinc finger HIT domain-containing protein n=1 Tax=Aspergillus karnatakaensis TaxID=1810916 RepID=UPI003CCD1109
MTSLCEVCAAEPFKYRCPTCGLMSCSLACTRTHKIYCAPKPTTDDASISQPQTEGAAGEGVIEDEHTAHEGQTLTPCELSPRIKELLERYPSLRNQLRDVYTATLQEQWVEGPAHGDRPRRFIRGKLPQRSHGPWTREKGFKRGLGKVRKYRTQCEDGSEVGKSAEGFMRLLTLVNEGTLNDSQ